MKSLILLGLSIAALQVHAGGGAVYCRDMNGKPQNIISEEWDSCNDQLYAGDVCFVGARAEVIKILNSSEVREKYDGTDGEYIKGAHYRGSGIGYYSVDEANQWNELKVINRCAPGALK